LKNKILYTSNLNKSREDFSGSTIGFIFKMIAINPLC